MIPVANTPEGSPEQVPIILVVDDNPTNLGVISNYLSDYGFRILMARSGESALEKAELTRPDLILLDILMPGLDGFQTCQRFKAQPDTQEIPIIFMTALADEENKAKGFAVGGVDYITKPLQNAEVVARVQTHLRLRNLTRTLKTQKDRLQVSNEALKRRNLQLETSSQVGQQITSILDLDELMARMVALIRSRFNYYFVGIWLLDEQQGAVALQAGAGVEGLDLPSLGRQIPMSKEDSIIVWVCRSCDYYLVKDVKTAARYNIPAGFPEVRSELALPLRIGDESLGVLDILSNQADSFSDEDKVVLQMLADQIAIAIRNAQSYKIEQSRRRLAESLEQTGRILSSDLDFQRVPHRVLEQLAEVVPYKRGLILLRQDDQLRPIAHRGYLDPDKAREIQISIHYGDIFQRLVDTHQPIIIDDVSQDPSWLQLDWLPLHHSWLGAPLITKDRVIGILSLTRPPVKAFTLDDATLVLAFPDQAAIALENASLYDHIRKLNEDLERKVAERTEELNQAYETLERLDKTKTDFINVTSHELRTPLSVIKGYSQVLEILPVIQNDTKAKNLLDGILSGANRMHQIVTTMLDVIKIDAQVLETYREKTRVATVVHEVYKTLEEVLEERRLTFTAEDLDRLPSLQADSELLFKAFHNLVINAIKYTPDGGRITVSGRESQLSTGLPAIDIIVSDDGIEVDPEHHRLIFEKFYQTGEVALHSTGQTKFKGGGPGLGLAVVYGIVQAHHGQVWVESEGYDEAARPGSRFYVRLPLEQPDPLLEPEGAEGSFPKEEIHD